MICYLIRHGKDDETVRGGWSDLPLTDEGIHQIEMLTEKIANLSVQHIYSSDLRRAMETAEILSRKLGLQITSLPEFREVNNGELAGMDNTIALERYPGLFWNQLEWEQPYPRGESPKQFYERIRSAWDTFSKKILSKNKNVILITHGGVVHIIRSIVEKRPYNNKDKQRSVKHGEMIALSYEDGAWKEKI